MRLRTPSWLAGWQRITIMSFCLVTRRWCNPLVLQPLLCLTFLVTTQLSRSEIVPSKKKILIFLLFGSKIVPCKMFFFLPYWFVVRFPYPQQKLHSCIFIYQEVIVFLFHFHDIDSQEEIELKRHFVEEKRGYLSTFRWIQSFWYDQIITVQIFNLN